MRESTILITVSDSAITRNLLDTSLIAELQKQNLRIVLVCPELREAHYRERYEPRGVTVVSLPVARPSFIERLFAFAVQNAFHSQTLYLMQWRGYLSGQSKIHPYVKQLFALLFGWSLVRRTIRIFDRTRRSHPAVKALFDAHQPSLVLSTMLLDAAIDVPVMREAKHRGVPTIGMIRSWDNLTTYGFLRILPDLFIAQNKFIRDMAVERHDVPTSRIRVVGLPHYDAYVAPRVFTSREAFLESLDLDPKKPLWVYAAVGDFVFQAEASLAPILDDIAGRHGAQVLFRAHPAHASGAERLTSLKHVRFDRTVAYLGENFGEWEMRAEHEAHLINTLHHADALITASGTSMLVDASVFDTPLVSVAFDGDKNVPYWFSIRRFFDHADHSRALLAQEGTWIVNSKDELETALEEYARTPSLRREGRARIRALLADPLGGASHRLADELIRMIDRKRDRQVP